MPLDEFYIYSPDLDNYAEQLLVSKCLGPQGYEWPVPWQDAEYPQAEDFNAIGFRLFTPELAEKRGYQFAPPANNESTELWREFVSISDAYFPNQELDDALFACTEQIREKDKKYSMNADGQGYLAGLAIQADQVVLQDKSVIDATTKWRECLEPQVDFALPEDPRTGMPPASKEELWGSVGGVASAAEIAAAVADAECRESSGLAELAYEKNWDEQLKLVEKNRDTLDRIRADAIERKEYLLTIVAENAPPAP